MGLEVKQKKANIVKKATRQWKGGVVRFAVMNVKGHPESNYIIFEKDLLGRGERGHQRFNMRLHDWNNLKNLIEVDLRENHQWVLDNEGITLVPINKVEDIHKILENNPDFISTILDYPGLENLSKESFESLNRLAVRIYEIQSKNLDSILNKLSRARSDEFQQFAALLNDLQLGQISSLADIVRQKIKIINLFEKLADSPETKEKEIHRLIENNPWVAGKKYEITSSDETLQKYLREKSQPAPELRKRPDLIAHRIPYQNEIILIELKRPSVKLAPKHIGQILEYKSLIENYKPNTQNIDCFIFGYERNPAYRINSKDVTIKTFSELIDELKDEYKEYLSVLNDTYSDIENSEYSNESQEDTSMHDNDCPF